MKMKTLRRLRATAPRQVRRRAIESDPAVVADDASTPEVVFDRMTGPYASRFSAFDEET